MALFIADISHHQGDISIQALKDAGCPAVIARVGQGAGRRTNGQTYGTTQDRKWARDLAEARRVGLRIVPYWYIGNLISADENARLAAQWVGDTSLPWMLDHEDASGSIAFYHEVRAAFARRGLRVVLGYVPRWYWEGAGGRAPLTPGPPLMSSRYSTTNGTPAQIYAAAGGDSGPGWASYGGQQVALWQFTNKASMAGQAIDCSAFRGTPTQLAALLGGAPPQEDDMSAEAERKIDNIHAQLVGDDAKDNEWGATPPDQYAGWPMPDGTRKTLVTAITHIYGVVEKVSADLAELKSRPAADVDEAALAAELDSRGIGGVSAAELIQILSTVRLSPGT